MSASEDVSKVAEAVVEKVGPVAKIVGLILGLFGAKPKKGPEVQPLPPRK